MKEEILDVTEPRSSIAAILPTLLGILFSIYEFGISNISLLSAFIFLIVVIFMQLSVNVWNNIADFKHNTKDWQNSYNNSLKNGKQSEKLAYIILLITAAISFVGGMILVVTNKFGLTILFIGILGAMVAFFYSGTKFAISNSPFGELASGVTMGFLILFGVVLSAGNQLSNLLIVKIVILSIMPVMAIANIMFANNMSDRLEDEKQGRKTLVYYLGIKKSLNLFSAMYFVGYGFLLIAIVFKIIPATSLLVLFSLFPVIKNIKIFKKNQIKSKTFILSIQNAAIITITLLIGILLGVIFNVR
ncbi:MAG: prenyltransferase [Lactobacillaceae bacterium]|jgi:1,4-dihydroxy-2-naphthoate octaprenyltransferase|nr:prenyltransferase [Lactobacillaceae bacterium]